MFDQNDIVINFYRNTVYRFDRENKIHVLNFYRCRLATFAEAEKFAALKKDIVNVKEIGVRRVPGSLRFAEIKINLPVKQLMDLHRFAKQFEVKTYEAAFYHILRNVKTDKDKEIECLKKEIEELKNKLKDIGKMLKF